MRLTLPPAPGTGPVAVAFSGGRDSTVLLHLAANDAASRARFRLALEASDRAFLVEVEDDDLERMTVVWDLEGAEPVTGLNAA